jgi:hypothetical protein
MADGFRFSRPSVPKDPFSGSLTFYGLIAATGFAVGWLSQVLAF